MKYQQERKYLWTAIICITLIFGSLLVFVLIHTKDVRNHVEVKSGLCADYTQLKVWCSDSCISNNQKNNPYIYSNDKDIYICSCINSVENGTQNYVPVGHIVC